MGQNTTDIKHNHIEAFKLMTYECQDCGHSEVVWNSRDGVTPFGINCPECASWEMYHIDWNKDIYAPDHVPVTGQLVFIDVPESLKPAIIRRRIQAWKGTEHEVPNERQAGLIDDLVKHDFQPGAPYVIRWGYLKNG